MNRLKIQVEDLGGHALTFDERMDIAQMEDKCGTYTQLVFAHDRLFGIQPLNQTYAPLKQHKRIVNSAYGAVLGWLNPRLRLAARAGMIPFPSACHDVEACIQQHLIFGYPTDWLMSNHHCDLFDDLVMFDNAWRGETAAQIKLLREYVHIALIARSSIETNADFETNRIEAAYWLREALRADNANHIKGKPTASLTTIEYCERIMARKTRPKLRLIKGGKA